MKKLIAIVCLPFVAALLWAQSAKIEGSLTAAASAVMDWSTAAVTRPFALFSSASCPRPVARRANWLLSRRLRWGTR